METRGVTRVDLVISTTVTWDDQWQFGYPDDFTWNFSNKNFFLSVTLPPTGTNPTIVTWKSTLGEIVVVDPVNRILGMNVAYSPAQSARSIQSMLGGNAGGDYNYELVMTDLSTGATDLLMYGELEVAEGIPQTS